jgi:hypothetical protein
LLLKSRQSVVLFLFFSFFLQVESGNSLSLCTHVPYLTFLKTPQFSILNPQSSILNPQFSNIFLQFPFLQQPNLPILFYVNILVSILISGHSLVVFADSMLMIYPFFLMTYANLNLKFIVIVRVRHLVSVNPAQCGQDPSLHPSVYVFIFPTFLLFLTPRLTILFFY